MTRIVLVLAVVLTALHTSAQSAATGFPMYGSFDSQAIASVNLQNLNYHIGIPIVGSPGRKLSLNLGVSHDSSIWTILGGAWTPRTDQSGIPDWGWDFNNVTGRLLYTTSHDHCTGDPHGLNLGATHYFNFALVAPDRTVHAFDVRFQIAGDCGTTSGSTTGYATDNSGYFMDGSVMNVWDRAGTRTGNQLMEDTNGNQEIGTVNPQNFAELDWTDSVGRIGLKVTSAANGTWNYNYLDSSGAYQTVSTDTLSMNIKTSFGCAGIVEYTGTASLPQHIYLPNLQKYTITYESTPGFSGYYTGRIKSIALPSGGSVQFTYTGANDGINCSDASTNGLQIVANDGTNASTKTFSRAPSGSNSQTTITNPQLPYDAVGNQTTVTFNAAGQETTRLIYQGNASPSNLLRTVNTTWASNGTPSSRIALLEDGQTQSQIDASFDVYGNLLSSSEHDWGAGVAGPIMRTTTNTYSSDAKYTIRHILNMITDLVVTDSTGVARSRQHFGYDAGTLSPCPTGIPGHDDSGYGCSFLTRGNLTSVTTYANASVPSGAIVKNYLHDVFGNLVQADVDCCQLRQWTYSGITNYSYPDAVTSGAGGGTQLKTSQTYNFSAGTVASSTDENGHTTTYTYDHMNRILTISYAGGSSISYSYDDAGNSNTVSTPIQATDAHQTKTQSDGLGRTIKTSSLDASNNSYSIVETQYDSFDRPYRTSNPHNSIAQYWNETHFDALGRVTVQFGADGTASSNNIKYTYSGKSVTIANQSINATKQQLDGLGRVVKTFEPDVANGNTLTQETDISFSVLNRVTQTVQGSQTRTYSYDDLGRLLSVQLPETNQVPQTMTYNSFNLVSQQTDPRGVITSYTYDNLNRPKQISYNVGNTGVPATASIGYTYDELGAPANALGKLTTMTDGLGSEKYTYDGLEQLTIINKVISGTTYTTKYAFNLSGELSGVTYPSARVLQQNYDAIGRLCGVGPSQTNCTSSTEYAGSFVYNPANQITSFKYANGVTASMTYSPDRLQLTGLNYTAGTQSLLNLSYWYKTDATNCPAASSGNNGQIRCIGDSVDAGRNESVSYDALGRVTSAVTTGSVGYPKWGLSFTYDRYGNRTAQTVIAGMAPSNSVAVSALTNRITTPGYLYDANGNMTNDGSNSLSYDAGNHLVASVGGLGSGTYSYDGNGLRVKRVSGGITTVYVFSGTRVIAEYANGAAPATPTREYLYSGGVLLAKIEAAVTSFYHRDYMSVRSTTDSSGNLIGQQAHYPFGEPWYGSGTVTKWKFATYEQDPESGNNYAMARYDISRLARFSTPDGHGGSTAIPQSLNRYSFVQNDPVNSADPSGMLMIPGFGWINWGAGEGGFDSLWDPFYWDDNSDTQTLQTGTSPDEWVPSAGQETGGYLPGVPADGQPDWGRTDGGSLTSGSPQYDSFVYLGGIGGDAAGKGRVAAELILFKGDCLRYIGQLAFSALLTLQANDMFAEAFNFAMSTEANVAPTMAATLANTTYLSAPTPPTPSGFITMANTNTSTAATSRFVNIFPPYSLQTPLAQGQTLIHEAVHDAFGLSDQQLAQAATGQSYANTPLGQAQASDAWNKQLIKHCK